MGKKFRGIPPETVVALIRAGQWATAEGLAHRLYPHFPRCSEQGQQRILRAVQSALTRACNQGLLKPLSYGYYKPT